jgi:alkylation response protein AidB-like acyl-CoA dehydrogenase
MQLVLNDDQQMLTEAARGLVGAHCPPARVRALRGDDAGFDPELWAKMVELGWSAIPFSEGDGGLGLGVADVVCVTEALGRGLATEPFLSNVMLAGACLGRAGTPEQKAAWLKPMIGGEKHLALALYERGARFDPHHVTVRAEKGAKGYRIVGEKNQVLGGNVADAFVVVARTSGADADRDGLSLFVVPRSAAGVEVVRQRRIDATPVALLRLNDVELGEDALVGALDRGADVLEPVIDAATVALSGELLGVMTQASEMTLRYLKEREQFGVLIGTFQALKHRAARMYIELELTRSAVMAAARALDEEAPDAQALVSVAKARASEACLLVANEAIQMHGGIGMTDEHDIGFFLKRARAAEMTLGDAAYHRRRFAALSGF